MFKNVLLFFLLVSPFFLKAQVIKGTISDVNGEPIPFAKIRINNTAYGTVSNAIGVYQLEVKNSKSCELVFSAMTFQTEIDTLILDEDVVIHDVQLKAEALEIEEVTVISKTKKERGKEIMKEVIDKRPYFYEQMGEYSCDTYCFASLEKDKKDTIFKDSVIGREKMNIIEWAGRSYFKRNNKYKDVITGYNDISDKQEAVSSASVSVSFGEDYLDPHSELPVNPYLFVNGIKDAGINLFENLIEAPQLCQGPIVSPMAYNAFVYYNFFLVQSFFDQDNNFVYQIQVTPKFKEEALFEGNLFIRDKSWELVSYDLGINKGALSFFKEMRLICDYEKKDEKLTPTRREFVYLIKEGKTNINGKIRLLHSNYGFKVDDSPRKFWLETQVYEPEALDRDTSYWNQIRPFHLKDEEIEFIRTQDSIKNYYASEQYLRQQDSTFNNFSFLNLCFSGIGYRNTFKKSEIFMQGLINQIIPLGVGGFRYRLNVSYDKGFKSGKAFSINPMVDYGFYNKDLKGVLSGSYLYDPMKFSKIYVSGGDVYEFMTNVQNITGSILPTNRIRNKKIEVYHRMEVMNGLYLKTGIFFSDRSSIENIKYPVWMDTILKYLGKPAPFDGYRIFMTDIEFAYHFKQKYIIRNNQKYIVGSQYPVLSLLYKKGIPKLFGGQSNFDYIEVRLEDEGKLNTLGNFSLRVIGGAFLHKKDLRIVEHKFFRQSDWGFFSDPVNTLQLLDTSLNTSNSYFQANFIHHFNGFFLNKVWLINKLKLQETVGGSFLAIPDSKFAHIEFYAGLERQFRIRKTIFKIGFYAITGDNSFDPGKLTYKIGFNFYDSFHKKWEY